MQSYKKFKKILYNIEILKQVCHNLFWVKLFSFRLSLLYVNIFPVYTLTLFFPLQLQMLYEHNISRKLNHLNYYNIVFYNNDWCSAIMLLLSWNSAHLLFVGKMRSHFSKINFATSSLAELAPHSELQCLCFEIKIYSMPMIILSAVLYFLSFHVS